MKKNFVFGFLVAVAMSSCTTLTKTATTVDVANNLNSNTSADLVVSQSKITYQHVVPSKERKAGAKNAMRCAVSEALKANGNADVLVGAQYEMVEKRGLFGKRIKTITVTGYPATYKNFRVNK